MIDTLITEYFLQTVGSSGCGKSTFLKYFFSVYSDTDIIQSNYKCETIANSNIVIEKVGNVSLIDKCNNHTVSSFTIRFHLPFFKILLIIINIIKNFQLYSATGYGDKIDNSDTIENIKHYIVNRHRQWEALEPQTMTEQEVLDADERIHCLFYFITPHRMKAIDIEFINQLSSLVPIIPIVSKADMMTIKERNTFLTQIKLKIDYISSVKGFYVIHNFPHDIAIDKINSSTTTNKNDDMEYQVIPNIFSTICGTIDMQSREHSWTSHPAESEQFSDLRRLKYLFFENGKTKFYLCYILYSIIIFIIIVYYILLKVTQSSLY